MALYKDRQMDKQINEQLRLWSNLTLFYGSMSKFKVKLKTERQTKMETKKAKRDFE